MRRSPRPLPTVVVALGWLGLATCALPVVALLLAVPWPRFLELISSPGSLDALRVTLVTGSCAVVIDALLGVPVALLLSRSWRGVRWARAAVLVPLALPPVVAGVALVALLGRRSPLGAALESAGLSFAFTPAAVTAAQVFVSLPFLVVTLEAALGARSGRTDEVAATLGASPWRVLTRITLPEVGPALGRGLGLAAARILGEFGATLTFAGSMPGLTRTLPLEIYVQREVDPPAALALGALLVGVAVGIAVASVWTPKPRPAVTDATETLAAAPANAATPVAIEATGTVARRGWTADFRAEPGEVVAVMGRNGVGKTTLIDVLAGLLPLDSGRVDLGGRVVDGPRFVGARDRHVALVPQSPSLFTHMTVLDNVAFGPLARGVTPSQARTRALAELAAVGCAALADRDAHALSSGQAARVALARALANDPAILLLDEPTASLDPDAALLVVETLTHRLAQGAPTTVLVTHDRSLAEALASRIVTMTPRREAPHD